MNQPAVTQPFDVRVMNATASVVFMAAFVLALAAVVMWGLRNPAFAIVRIVVDGQPAHSSALAVQTQVVPSLQGNLFTVDLDAARAAFERMPWVRHATINRVFPNTLEAKLEEHVPIAYWVQEEAGSLMINSFGEVFEANRGEIEHENLPSLSGPTGQSAKVLDMYRRLKPLLDEHGVALRGVFLDGRGNWQAIVGKDGHLELGVGSADELQARLARFLLSLPQALEPMQRRVADLEYADLRYANGYAIRLKGVITGPNAGEKAKSRMKR